VIVGDIGPSAATDLRADPYGSHWAAALLEVQQEIDGDLNFMNLEGVVTDRADLPPDNKSEKRPLHFRIHPRGLQYLVSRGFNLISLANNHSMDFGIAGLDETSRYVEALREYGPLAASGIGRNREQASAPQLIRVQGATVAFASIGIVTNNLERF